MIATTSAIVVYTKSTTAPILNPVRARTRDAAREREREREREAEREREREGGKKGGGYFFSNISFSFSL
jgi:hypothetical protein